MAKNTKTNAMRQLEKFNITYDEIAYDLKGEFKSAMDVAEKINLDSSHMLKTLATISKAKNINIFVIPADQNLDMKKCAKAANEKSISILPTKDLKKEVGYQRGETTALAMKKDFPVFIEKSVEDYDYIIVSGGKKGISLKLKPKDFKLATNASFEDLIQ
ncbi:MAG: YbaK/EbsC family protein [Peptoniphilaceae bacterium]|nr:YbaK/EbsC family protein [Peptoniphilaceae bacterium]MDY6018447.1 YbaK/EbsC family protein [Anaerococcus sp.]